MGSVRDLLESVEFRAPGNVLEAALLAVCLGLTLALYARAAGWPAAVLATLASVAAFLQIGHVSVPLAIATAGLALWIASRRGRRIARPTWAVFGGELLLIVSGFVLYEFGRIATRGDSATAIANGNSLVSFEKRIHLFVEPRIQEFVLQSDVLTRVLNLVYSHGFLAVTVGVLFWLYFADPARYRLFRNCLGISAILAVATIAALPTAPPRLLPEGGLADTVVVLGNKHYFTNEYAALPSLHTGWTALAGFVVALGMTSRWRIAVAVLPGTTMLVTVMATGNHYWVDGLVGSAFSVVPAVALTHWPKRLPDFGRAWARLAERSAGESQARTRMSVLSLGGLLVYLVVERIDSPGFTDFWGYLTAQTAIILVLVVVGERVFAREGGLSWLTHLIIVATVYADVLGTDGNFYARIGEYDKVTHFAGVAAITAGVYDCLRALAARHGGGHSSARLWLSVSAGILMGIGWEVYEYLGDVVFHTARTQGTGDTAGDLVFDALGAIVLGAVLWRMELGGRAEQPVAESEGVPLL